MDVPQKNMSRLIVNKDLGERSKNMNSLEPKKLQICLTKMLEEFDYICRKEGLTYVMFGGTFLGAVRHKGFIPWDNDIDVAMPRKIFTAYGWHFRYQSATVIERAGMR